MSEPTFDATCAAVCRAITNAASAMIDKGLDPKAVIAGMEAALAGFMAGLPSEYAKEHVARFPDDVDAVRARLSERDRVAQIGRASRATQ